MTPETTDAHLKVVEAKLGEWGARLELLKAKLATAGAAGNVEVEKQLHHLQELHSRGTQHLSEVRATAATAWQATRKAALETWGRLSAAAEEFWKGVKM